MCVTIAEEDYGLFMTDPKTGRLRTGGEHKLVIRDKDNNVVTTFPLSEKELAESFLTFLNRLNETQLTSMKEQLKSKPLVIKGGVHRRQQRHGFRD